MNMRIHAVLYSFCFKQLIAIASLVTAISLYATTTNASNEISEEQSSSSQNATIPSDVSEINETPIETTGEGEPENKVAALTNLFPTYGNWCGANHPVNMKDAEDPIDGLDTACQRHDICYAENGYLDCECDSQFRNEVEEGILSGEYQGNEAKIARTFRIYFHGSPCQGDPSNKIAPSRDIHNIVKNVTKVGKKVASDFVERAPFIGSSTDDQQ